VRSGVPPSYVRPTVNREAAWVLAGEGRATRKWDGTCCLIRDGQLLKRVTLRRDKPTPGGFELVEVDTATGKRYGWAPLAGPADQWHREGWANLHALGGPIPDGTYELVGPKINGNPDRFTSHQLIKHGWAQDHVELADLDTSPREYWALGAWLQARPYEGIVWHHPDGRMCKLKARDYPTLVQVATAAAGYGVAA
jgi:hypothetical protein